MRGHIMSGHKHATVTISQDEYRRLHELDMDRRFNKKKKSEEGDSRYNALLEAYQQIEERQKEYENLVAEMNQEMAAIEAEQSSDILAFQSEYYQSLITTLQDLQEENIGTQAAIRETTRYFEEVLQSERTKTQERYSALLEQISLIGQEQNLKEEQTREWLESCKQVASFIHNQYDHEKFFPKSYDRILQRLNMGIQNLNRGYVDSGLQFAQEAFLQFSELRVSLEEKTSEWQASYDILSSELHELFEQVSSNSVVPAIGVDGEDLNIEIDLDYWSNGKYSDLENRLKTLLPMLKSFKQEINFDDLVKIATELIPTFKEYFNEIIFEARQNSINSQIKINVAYLAMKALEKHGFSLKQAQYENDDMRDAFSAQLCDPDGSNIILQITPNKVNNSNNLVIDTIDDTIHTEDEYIRRWEEINHTLTEAGVEVGQVHASMPNESKTSETSRRIKPVDKPILQERNPYYVQPHTTPASANHT